MSKIRNYIKIATLSVVLTGTMLLSFADRGISKKSGKKVTLNIPTHNNFKKALSVNLKAGLKYTGSLIAVADKKNFSSVNHLISYQKGNTIYIVPFKQKVIVSEIRPGYTGMKLVIKSN